MNKMRLHTKVIRYTINWTNSHLTRTSSSLRWCVVSNDMEFSPFPISQMLNALCPLCTHHVKFSLLLLPFPFSFRSCLTNLIFRNYLFASRTDFRTWHRLRSARTHTHIVCYGKMANPKQILHERRPNGKPKVWEKNLTHRSYSAYNVQTLTMGVLKFTILHLYANNLT